ncbi:hypothetical protein [Nocardia sienata]|uniref:hypothetical protein n=1 Tax=Nocardia sienata TaxID=248552 RepID=UPI000B2984A3|nr:hypothetical protein [Nocardia sienata]
MFATPVARMTAAVDDEAGADPRARWTALATAAIGPALIVVLIVDAVITSVLEVLYLPFYLGSVAVPLAALIAAPVNVALVWAAATVTTRSTVLFLPIAAWLAVFLIAASRGPGGDVPLRNDLPTLLLFLCGSVAPLIYMYVAVNRTKGPAR